MNTTENYKKELDRYAEWLCDMLTEHARDLNNAITADFKIMTANLNHDYAEKLEKLKKG